MQAAAHDLKERQRVLPHLRTVRSAFLLFERKPFAILSTARQAQESNKLFALRTPITRLTYVPDGQEDWSGNSGAIRQC